MKTITTNDGNNAAHVHKPLAVIALALALIIAPIPQPAFADHCDDGTHLSDGRCVPNINIPDPNPPVFIPQHVPTPPPAPDYTWVYWLLGGVVVIGFVAGMSNDGSAFAPDDSSVLQGWQMTDDLGGIGMSRALGEKTRLTFATDLPTDGEVKQVRAEVKFSF